MYLKCAYVMSAGVVVGAALSRWEEQGVDGDDAILELLSIVSNVLIGKCSWPVS